MVKFSDISNSLSHLEIITSIKRNNICSNWQFLNDSSKLEREVLYIVRPEYSIIHENISDDFSFILLTEGDISLFISKFPNADYIAIKEMKECIRFLISYSVFFNLRIMWEKPSIKLCTLTKKERR
jgi:hypothetical protein